MESRRLDSSTRPHQLSSCSPTAHPFPSQTLSRFSVEVQNLLRDFNPVMTGYTIQKLIEAVDKLLEAPMDLET